MPDILCTGHDLQREVKGSTYAAFAQKSLLMTQMFERLLPGEANFGLEPSWTQIYPYQSLAKPGDTLNLQIRMMNFLPRRVQADVSLALPQGWTAAPEVGRLEIGPNARGTASFRVHIPASYVFPYPRIAIAADVTFEGRRLGQITEATVEQAT
jgi:hypothetical protein